MNAYFSSFHFVCRVLSFHFKSAELEALRHWIKDGPVTWEVVVEVANDYLVGPAFWGSLMAKNLYREVAAAPAQYFSELHRLNRERNRHLRQQMLEAMTALQRAGVKTLLLKGASQLVQPIHADTGSRIMADLDLLIGQGQYELAADALAPLGYRSKNVTYNTVNLHHHTPLFRPGDYGCIELHRHAVHLDTLHILPTSNIWEDAQLIDVDGLKLLLPSPSHAVMINLLHSQVCDNFHYLRHFNLRALLDFTAIQVHYGGAIQWPSIRSVLRSHGLGSIVDAYAFAAKQLLNAPLAYHRTIGPTTRLQHIACLATVRWPLASALALRSNDFSKKRICQRYACSEKRISIAAHQFRYLLEYLRTRSKNL